MIHFNRFMKNKLIYSYDITMRCNLRCSYCYATDILDNKKSGDVAVADKVVQAFKDYKENYPGHIIELDLLGGDPLVAANIWDFIDAYMETGFDLWIITNLMMGKRTLTKAKEYLNKYPKLGICATWHSEIDDEKFKENLLFFKDATKPMYNQVDEVTYRNFVTSFVLFNDNPDMYEKAKWAVDNDISYGITILYDDQMLYRREMKDTWTEETKWVWRNSYNYTHTKWTWDDEPITLDQFEDMKLSQISHNYNLVCYPNNWHIRYDGETYNSCNYLPRIRKHIDDGIHPKKLYCKDMDCKCSVTACKEVYSER